MCCRLLSQEASARGFISRPCQFLIALLGLVVVLVAAFWIAFQIMDVNRGRGEWTKGVCTVLETSVLSSCGDVNASGCLYDPVMYVTLSAKMVVANHTLARRYAAPSYDSTLTQANDFLSQYTLGSNIVCWYNTGGCESTDCHVRLSWDRPSFLNIAGLLVLASLVVIVGCFCVCLGCWPLLWRK